MHPDMYSYLSVDLLFLIVLFYFTFSSLFIQYTLSYYTVRFIFNFFYSLARAGEIESALSSLEPVRVSPVAVLQESEESCAGARADADEDEVSSNERSPIAPIGQLTVTQRFRSDEVRVIWREHEQK